MQGGGGVDWANLTTLFPPFSHANAPSVPGQGSDWLFKTDPRDSQYWTSFQRVNRSGFCDTGQEIPPRRINNGQISHIYSHKSSKVHGKGMKHSSFLDSPWVWTPWTQQIHSFKQDTFIVIWKFFLFFFSTLTKYALVNQNNKKL